MKFFVIFLSLLVVLASVNSSCIMFGECQYDEERQKNKNCLYEDGKAPEALDKLDGRYEEALAYMKSYCPYFFYDEDGNEKGKTISNVSFTPQKKF